MAKEKEPVGSTSLGSVLMAPALELSRSRTVEQDPRWTVTTTLRVELHGHLSGVRLQLVTVQATSGIRRSKWYRLPHDLAAHSPRYAQ